MALTKCNVPDINNQGEALSKALSVYVELKGYKGETES
ncbi:hypothetical protein W04_2263 [Pseudoalteromonas sp. SW0106-04]|nr:hypothetical protein W04_2263 [Pseudoalteromonas sp. SW0106-04]